jgi:hypothetical protein
MSARPKLRLNPQIYARADEQSLAGRGRPLAPPRGAVRDGGEIAAPGAGRTDVTGFGAWQPAWSRLILSMSSIGSKVGLEEHIIGQMPVRPQPLRSG